MFVHVSCVLTCCTNTPQTPQGSGRAHTGEQHSLDTSFKHKHKHSLPKLTQCQDPLLGNTFQSKQSLQRTSNCGNSNGISSFLRTQYIRPPEVWQSMLQTSQRESQWPHNERLPSVCGTSFHMIWGSGVTPSSPLVWSQHESRRLLQQWPSW